MAAIQDLLAPIHEERPGGVEVRYGIDYSRVESLHYNVRHPPDAVQDQIEPREAYEEIVEVAERILSAESKDLKLAILFAEARLALDGFAGLAEGLALVAGLVDRFWDHLFPEGLEDRVFELEFLGEGFVNRGERYDPMVYVELTQWGHGLHEFDAWRGVKKDSFGGDDPKAKKGKAQDVDDPRAPTSENFERGFAETPKARYKALSTQLSDCDAAVEALEARVKERFAEVEGPKPSFSKLKTALSRAKTAVGVLLARKLESDPDPPGEGDAAGAQDGAAPASPASEPVGDGAGAAPSARPAASGGLTPEPRDGEDAVGRIAAAARFLRRAEPTNPVPYLLVRALRWGELRKGGGALDVRLLAAPPTELRTRLKTLLLEGDWAALVEAGEEVMASPCGRGWLDLQRYVVTALEGLGGSYRPVVGAVRHEIAALLRDVPELTSRTLMDDTPTANVETLEWLALQGLTAASRDGKDVAKPAPDYDRERVLSEATHEKALEWVAAGNPSRGVELLMRRAEREESPRARFVTESLAASILVDAGMIGVARPMLEDLVDLVTKRTLDQWEPAELVARPIGLLYRCLPPNDRRRAQLYDQICRLDPMLAISLDRQEKAGPTVRGAQESSDEPTSAPQDAPPVDPGSAGG